VPGVELKLVDDGGREVHADDPGEILVRGANVFSGYWPDSDGGPGPDGWLATGDIGFLDHDGDLFLVDRLKELVIVSGFNVYPAEVEEVLLAHPAVADAGVIGVPHPHTGEAVKAFVVLADGASIDEDALIDHCRDHLARYKCPTSVLVVDALPA